MVVGRVGREPVVNGNTFGKFTIHLPCYVALSNPPTYPTGHGPGAP